MPAAAPPPVAAAAASLAALGDRLRARRKALKVSATTTAEAAGLSRVTLHRIERGHPSVTVGAVAAVAHALGLDLVVVDPAQAASTAEEALPETLPLSSYPQLRQLAWQLKTETVTPAEALALYERNWRHVDAGQLSDDERALIRRLVRALGGRLLV